MPRRRGFTLIEILMVVLVMAVLIGLMLPAVQSVRQAALTTQCRNNLLQLGMALGNYASTHQVFPPGVVNDKGPIANLPKGYHMGWAVQILPFLEQGNLYRRIDFRRGVYAAPNASVLATSLGVFLCPGGRGGAGSYVGCHHDVEAPIDADNHGVLFLNSHVGRDDITDGTAYTILLGEARVAMTMGWAAGTEATLRNTGHRINEPVWTIPSAGWAGPSPPGASGPNDSDGVNTIKQGGPPPMYYVGGFSSGHVGGANLLFCDGSLRFLKESVDPRVLRLLGHRSDGDIIDGEQY
jgi:prepilin-type N-terminal cleavage/methylation domain-containing protein/prepilin-type processing-associated H-X9-DG protein